MRLVAVASAILLVVSLGTTLATAAGRDFPGGALPLRFDSSRPFAVDATDVIVVRGTVTAPAGAIVVLRIDDGQSGGYASRVNLERAVPAGPFAWTVPVAGLKTSGGRVLSTNDIRHIVLFAADGKAAEASVFRIEPAQPMPAGVIALSLGRADAPLFPGFTRLAPDDRRIEAGRPVAIARPGLDPLITNGMRGVERIRLPWPHDRAQVSLWTEDVGEWETLPYALERRIRVNGVDVLTQRLSPAQWIAQRYLAGHDREAPVGADAWEVYGRHRGGLITADVASPDGSVVIELAGDTPAATFLAAVMVEPAGQRVQVDRVEEARAQWFRSAWPVAARTDSAARPSIYHTAMKAAESASAPPLTAVVTPGSGTQIEFSILADRDDPHPDVAVTEPEMDGARLDLDLRAASWRLERRTTGGNLLERRADYLRADVDALPFRAGEQRLFAGWVSAPRAARSGIYRGNVRIRAGGKMVDIPLRIEVLEIDLPEAPRPVGFYVEEAPHLTWFSSPPQLRRHQIGCDLDILGQFGIRGNAPPLAAPTAAGDEAFLQNSRIASEHATTAPWFAYAPMKRLVAEVGAVRTPGVIERAEHALEDRGLPPPVWSLADEPSNPDQNAMSLADLARDLRARRPHIRLAGQFNNPRDRKLLALFDTVLINGGFGLDRRTIEAVAARGTETWIYNTGRPRFTAGFWLWHTGAKRYLQWHARMPTADPFDPTDGREGDVQIFPPAAEPCPARPEFHRDLLDMADGVVDQRWLAWLDGRPESAARKVRRDLTSMLDRPWSELQSTPVTSMNLWRDRIIELARSLK